MTLFRTLEINSADFESPAEVANFIGLIEPILIGAGVVLLVIGIGMLIMALKDDRDDKRNTALVMIVLAIFLINISWVTATLTSAASTPGNAVMPSFNNISFYINNNGS